MALSLEDRRYTVYCHLFPNGKRYVGQTCQVIAHRFGKDGCRYQGQPQLYNAIKKYGWKNVQHEVLAENLSYLEVDAVEQFYIILYKSNQEEFGYNIEGGGSFHKVCTEATKEKLRKRNLGKKLSPETCKKMSESRKGEKNCNYGKHFSEEVRRRMGLGQIGRVGSMKGKHHSAESKLKMSNSKKGKPSCVVWTDEMKHKLSVKNKALFTEERRKALSDARLGGNNPSAVPVIAIDVSSGNVYEFDYISALYDFINIGHTCCSKYIDSGTIYKNKWLIYRKETYYAKL